VIGLILFGQNNLYVKMLFFKGFRYSKVFQKILQVRKVSSLPAVQMTCHSVWTIIYLQLQPSGQRGTPSRRQTDQASFVRTTCHTVRTPTDQASSVRTTWISIQTLHCIEKLLFQLASVRTPQQPVRTTSSDRSASDFLSKFK